MKFLLQSFDLASGFHFAWRRILDGLYGIVAFVNLRLFGLILDENIMHLSDPVRNFGLEGMGQFLVDIVLHHFRPVDTFLSRFHLPLAEVTSKLQHKARDLGGNLL